MSFMLPLLLRSLQETGQTAGTLARVKPFDPVVGPFRPRSSGLSARREGLQSAVRSDSCPAASPVSSCYLRPARRDIRAGGPRSRPGCPAQVPDGRRSAEVRAAAESDRRRVRRGAAAADAAEPEQTGRGADVKARTYPTIAELAQPMYRLAGSRVNPKTNGPHRASGLPGTGIYSITLKKISDGSRNARQDAAAGAHLAREVLAGRFAPRLSPDKRRCDRAVGRRRHRPARRRPSSAARIGSTPRPAIRATG